MTTATLGATPPRKASWLAAFMRRDWKIARSYRLQFALDLATIPLTLAIFFYVGRLVDQGALADSGDLQHGYFAFAAVGLAVLRMVQTALTSFSTKLRTDQMTGTFEALLASPVSPSVVVLGSASFEIARAVVGGLLTILVAAPLGLRFHLGTESVIGLTVGLPALVASFAALGVAVASCAVVFKQVTALLGLVTSGLALLSGVYFPTTLFPTPLRALADALPFTWGVDVLRGALLENDLPTARLGLLVGFGALSLPLSLRVFRLAVDQARRRGSLTQF